LFHGDLRKMRNLNIIVMSSWLFLLGDCGRRDDFNDYFLQGDDIGVNIFIRNLKKISC